MIDNNSLEKEFEQLHNIHTVVETTLNHRAHVHLFIYSFIHMD